MSKVVHLVYSAGVTYGKHQQGEDWLSSPAYIYALLCPSKQHCDSSKARLNGFSDLTLKMQTILKVPKGTSNMDAPPRDKLTEKIFPLPTSYFCPRMKWQQLERSWSGMGSQKGSSQMCLPTGWLSVNIIVIHKYFSHWQILTHVCLQGGGCRVMKTYDAHVMKTSFPKQSLKKYYFLGHAGVYSKPLRVIKAGGGAKNRTYFVLYSENKCLANCG